MIKKLNYYSNLACSFEELATGKTATEFEQVFYCRLSDSTELDKLESEYQEQWGLKIPTFNNLVANVRVRQTTSDQQLETPSVYTQTIKIQNNSLLNIPVRSELTIPTTLDGFNQFKLICEKGMIKRRYFLPFKIDGKEYKFEIDRFYKDHNVSKGIFEEWLKIDLELSDVSEVNKYKWEEYLPKSIGAVIKSNTVDLEEKKIISNLYSEKFITINKT